jgi:OOP family OmpA-OmpF porin
MMIKRTVTRLALGLALATASAAAMADAQTGWYFGLSGGQAQVDIDQDEFDALVEDTFASVGFPLISGSSSLEDSDTSFAAYGGYRFSQYFAVEGSFIDFGTAEYRASGNVNPPGPTVSIPASYSADFEVFGFTAGAVGTLPLGQIFDLHGRLGVMFADTEISENATVATASADETYSANTQEIFYGIGAGLRLGERWALSLDWHQYKDVGDEDDTGETDVDRISLGVTFKL